MEGLHHVGMTNNLSLDQLATNTPYDLFLKDDLDDEPTYRSVVFWKKSYTDGAPTADFRYPDSQEVIRGLYVSQYIARPAAAAN